MSKILYSPSFAFDSAHVKYGVWTWPQTPSTLRARNLKSEGLLWKRSKCFPCTVRRRKFKTEVSLWKHIKCFPSTLRRWNLKTVVSLWKLIKCFQTRLRRRNLKTEVSNSWLKRIECFQTTLRRRNLKTEVSLRKRVKCFQTTLRLRSFKNAAITGHILVFEEHSVRESHPFNALKLISLHHATGHPRVQICKRLMTNL